MHINFSNLFSKKPDCQPPTNEGMSKTAGRVISVALSVLTAFVSFTYLPWSAAFVVSLVVSVPSLVWGFYSRPEGVNTDDGITPEENTVSPQSSSPVSDPSLSPESVPSSESEEVDPRPESPYHTKPVRNLYELFPPGSRPREEVRGFHQTIPHSQARRGAPVVGGLSMSRMVGPPTPGPRGARNFN